VAVSELPRYRRQTIAWGEPAERTLLVAGDVDGDGVPELVVGTRKPTGALFLLRRGAGGEWRSHPIDDGFNTVEAGGVLLDLDGDGDLDLIAGQDVRGQSLFWWECPPDPTQRWTRREIWRMPASQSHDQLVADLDGDGRPELYFWNQRAEAIFWVPVPDEPRVTPWPQVRALATGVREEGFAVADVDGDGRDELIAGGSWYRPPATPGGSWQRHVFAEGYVAPRVVAADFDGDGRVEIALSEGDASFSRGFGRLVLFHQGAGPDGPWEQEVLHQRLLDPHSLAVADFDGDGRPDLFVGEMGWPRGNHPHPPALRIYQNRGRHLEEHVIDRGVGVHDARLVALDGRLCIVSKWYQSVPGEVPRPPEADGIHCWIPET
jgi:hypothetical protein